MRLFLRMTVIAVSLGALSACSLFSSSEPQPPCPRISVLADAASLTRFKPGSGRDLTDVELKAEFAGYKGSCEYDPDDRTMTLTLRVGIDATRGPAAKGNSADIAYFVAIPAFYPDPRAHAVLPVTITFPDNTDRVRYTDDEVSIAIPIAKLAELQKYKVYLGLQVDPDQLDYNRQSRLKQ
jgi:hypothetical protein